MFNESNFHTDLLIAFDKEPFLYFEYSEPEDIKILQNKLKLDMKIKGIKGTLIDIRFQEKNIGTDIHFINLLIEKYKKPILFFDAKSFQSFCLKFKSSGIIHNYIFDMFWFKNYIGHKTSSYNVSFQEVVDLFINFTKSNHVEIYNQVFKKLISKTIPLLENEFLVDDDTAEKLYPNYVIEGQENGRLNTCCNLKKCYNPHSLDDFQKERLVNHYENEYFVLFDFRSMEASVLASLSNDIKLLTVINSGKDPYEEIAKQIQIKDGNLRKLGKDIFLPVIYGISAQTLSVKMDISIDKASNYIDCLQKSFPDTFAYIDSVYKSAKLANESVDKFGRKRFFDPQNSYKSRNFVVQSSSATINQHILNVLVENSSRVGYKVLFINHDAYCLSIHRDNIKTKFYEIKTILESKIELVPNLVLFSEGKVGKKLNSLVKIKS